ncbi:O-antigen ligase [Chryseobacterium ginsenosidimutans]|uniref:O-antigen ligase family protein n=1 Tax=Chryseobacterium ginsenosidimutans TaxID=687846 RepID=UPI00278A2642|nr:O-antigen ligase family protein [Chryseobacterium ginsenosidimutans]MDQ0595112.1 O-antigen ligase [Chryseobacterium ginsenosidimutans]
MKIKNYIPFILIVSQIFGLFGGMLQVPRVLAIIFLPVLIKNFHKEILNNKIIVAFFFIYCLDCIISMLFLTENSVNAFKDFCYSLINCVIFIEIVNFSYNRKSAYLLKSWLIYLVLTIPIALIEISYNIHLPNSKFGDDTLIGGVGTEKIYAAITYGNYNLYNYIISISFPFLIACLSVLKRKFIVFTIILLIFYIVLMNGSRGAFICLIISLLIYIIFYSSNSINKKVVIIAVSSFLLTGGIYYIFQSDKFTYLQTRLLSKGLEDNTREEMINIGLQMFIDSKFVGVGASNFSDEAVLYTTSNVVAPHNIFIELISQYGLIVFLLFLALLYYSFSVKHLFEKRKKNYLHYIFVTSLVIFPISHTINSVYLSNPYLWIFLATLYSFSIQFKTAKIPYVTKQVR